MSGNNISDEFELAALEYHRSPRSGKLAVVTTKPMETQRDLSLAYSPGVAVACEAIVRKPIEAFNLTGRQNLVGVVTNGTAVLGLGDIGPLAAKPVMEGKAALFKKFAGIDVFDLEVAQTDPDRFVETVACLEPTFGGINLEDIRAPECFYIEAALRQRMNIPVFHDDQHGTAIIVAAAIINGLQVVGKDIATVKLVTAGSGAAALACLNLLITMGLPKNNIIVTDREGVVYRGRQEHMDPWKEAFAIDTPARTLDEVIDRADIFLGLSAPNVLKPEMLMRMADRPLVLALANPVPEIMPDAAKAVRPDAVLATGRSDFPNQVNNVLCFPYIFRGALDVGASTINAEMQLACVRAIAELAHAEPSDLLMKAYGDQPMRFGPDYLIPKPFDPRLGLQIAPAVAKAAMETGVATWPIEDMAAYMEQLTGFVFRTRSVMRPLFEKAKRAPKRLVYAEGEERRVLQAAQQVVDEGIAVPILVGRPAVIEERIEQLGLRLKAGRDFDLINILEDQRYRDYWTYYHQLVRRRGVSVLEAQTVVRTDATVVAALMVKRDDADAMLCGTVGRFGKHLEHIRAVIGQREGVHDLSTVTALTLPVGTYFLCDTHINPEPSVQDIVEATLLAAAQVRAFGLKPKVALLSRSNFGTHDHPPASKMREALRILHERAPELDVEGEMHGDVALSEELRRSIFGQSRLEGQANLLILPNGDAAHIAYSLLKVLGGGITVGPILLGPAKSAHIVTQSITVRGLVNMSAITVAQAQLGIRRRLPV
jgi:malate dehydrogenase (oxaloacetate-decarboxylating)(NADP+)